MSKSLGNGVPSQTAFEHFVEVCREMKEAGIEIYMYQFKGAPQATKFFKQCASSDDHYSFLNGDADLITAFEDLAGNGVPQEARLIR